MSTPGLLSTVWFLPSRGSRVMERAFAMHLRRGGEMTGTLEGKDGKEGIKEPARNVQVE